MLECKSKGVDAKLLAEIVSGVSAMQREFMNVKQARNTLQGRVSELQAKATEMQKTYSKLLSDSERRKQDAFSALSAKLSQAERELDETKHERVALTIKLSQAEREMREVITENDRVKAECEQKSAVICTLRSDIELLMQENVQPTAPPPNYQSVMDFDILKAELESARLELERKTQANARLEVELSNTGADLESECKKYETLRNKYSELVDDYNALIGCKRSVDEELESAVNKLESMRKKYKELTNEYNGLVVRYNEVIEEYNNLVYRKKFVYALYKSEVLRRVREKWILELEVHEYTSRLQLQLDTYKATLQAEVNGYKAQMQNELEEVTRERDYFRGILEIQEQNHLPGSVNS